MKPENEDIELTVRIAGARGGAVTYAKHGRRHFQIIGQRGQATLSSQVSSEQRRTWGALGGRPRKPRFRLMRENG